MTRKPIIVLISILVMGIVIGLSCSRNDSPISAPDTTRAQSSSHECLGEWTIVPSADLSSATIAPVLSPQFNVTKWAKVSILNSVWDPVLRTWTLTVKVSNPTSLTGWGIEAIFTNLGEKEMRWPDGFTWLDLDGVPGNERYPFFAVEKNTEKRIFEGLHSVTQDVTFYFPDGVDKWAPIKFFIDAYLNEARPNPMVEDLGMGYNPPPCYHSAVTAKIGDHQSTLDQISVWVDLSSMGGSANEPMFDDGNNDDGLAGDGIFGAKFSGGNFGTLYTFTAYAQDPEGNTGENDIWYSPIEYPPLPPVQYESLLQGDMCLISDEKLAVIDNQTDWETFWAEFTTPDVPIPIVDFTSKRVVAVCLGHRPDNCYHVEINDINWSSENCGWAVNYTETVPGPDCTCGDVVTSPYHLVLVNQASFDVMFKGDIYIDPCGGPADPCLDLYPVADGSFGNGEAESLVVITDETSLEKWWSSNAGSDPMPKVDFEKDILFAVAMGVKNTSGYYPTIDSACLDDTETLEITVGMHIPGPKCIVLPVITYPYVVVSTPKVAFPYYWTTYDDVYACK
jgi:hypothetical protein